MKKVKYIFITILVLVLTYGIIDELTFNPLNKKELSILFPECGNKVRCVYHKDFVGWSSRDYFDYFVFQLDTAHIDLNYPDWNKEWKHVSFPAMWDCSKWIHCPIEPEVYSKYLFELDEIAVSNVSDRKSLEKEIRNEKNYYCYIYVNNLEKYFFLYNPLVKKLYYIRQKGF